MEKTKTIPAEKAEVEAGPPVIDLAWSGKAVSKNRAHMACAHQASRRIINTPEYRSWVESMALQWMANRPKWPIEGRFDLQIIVQVGPRFDPQNVIDGVCDALEKGRIVVNDINVRNLVLQSLPRHKEGQPDKIWIRVSPGLLFRNRPKEEPAQSEHSDRRKKKVGGGSKIRKVFGG